jgi:hypothetical protein
MTVHPELRIGQVWADCDKRAPGRLLKIVELEHEPRYAEPRAICEVIAERSSGFALTARGSPTGKRRTVIRADRFRAGSTGYRLVEDAP